MVNNYNKDILAYFDRVKQTLDKIDIGEINNAMNAIVDVYERGGIIYIFGNGGSAATASHFVCDFNKGISEQREKKFNLICLNDNIPIVMAIANDIGYDEIFSFQLKNKLNQIDLVIGISGSGNSENVINAVMYAKDCCVKTIGITGYAGGKLREISDYSMHVPLDDMQVVEDIHMIFNHVMMRVFGDRL